MKAPLKLTFEAAVTALIERVKQDRSVLAAILCGSMSHDTVWAKSDVDLVLVTIDDRKVKAESKALWADGVNVHVMLMPRAEFRKVAEGSVRNSFMHAFLAKGRILYSRDDSIGDLFNGLAAIGERDTEIQMMGAATWALPSIYKAHKWFVTRQDLEYTALWLLYAATPLARVEVLAAKQLAGREVIQQALKLNPRFFKTIYTDLLNGRKAKAGVEAALTAVDRYLAGRAGTIFAPVLGYLKEAGEARSATDLEDHFTKNFGLEGIVTACEYLADQGLIGKASIPVRLTKKSSAAVEELAFFHLAARGTGRAR